jgi:2-polyprenyl-3-methyl-5-hydroxy-6-metoxy-1,4-benzoquinol methylase
MAELPSIYADPVHYDLLAQMTAPADVPFYLSLFAEHGGPVLELGCGTGRVSLPLARAGAEIWGVDVAAPLLDQARLKAAAEALRLRLFEADMRELDLGRRFALVIVPYNAFNHLLDRESVERCLGAVRNHLGPRGLFVIDTFNPDPKALGVEPSSRSTILEYIDPYTHERVVLEEQNAYDAARQVNRTTWRYHAGDRTDARVDELDMRIFFPQELDALLHYQGFEVVSKLGDYGGTPFGARSPKQLTFCRVTRTRTKRSRRGATSDSRRRGAR